MERGGEGRRGVERGGEEMKRREEAEEEERGSRKGVGNGGSSIMVYVCT